MGVFAIIKHTVDVGEKPVLLSGSLLNDDDDDVFVRSLRTY